MSKRIRGLRTLGLALFAQMAVANAPPPSMTFLRMDGDFLGIAANLRKDATLPVPVVAVSIHRGQVDFSNESNLDDGVLWFRVTLPESRAVAGSEVGFLFQLVSGDLPSGLRNQISTPYAVKSLRMSEGAFDFNFYWVDGAPSQHEPMDFTIDVSAVTADGRVGPPAKVRIK